MAIQCRTNTKRTWKAKKRTSYRLGESYKRGSEFHMRTPWALRAPPHFTALADGVRVVVHPPAPVASSAVAQEAGIVRLRHSAAVVARAGPATLVPGHGTRGIRVAAAAGPATQAPQAQAQAHRKQQEAIRHGHR